MEASVLANSPSSSRFRVESWRKSNRSSKNRLRQGQPTKRRIACLEKEPGQLESLVAERDETVAVISKECRMLVELIAGEDVVEARCLHLPIGVDDNKVDKYVSSFTVQLMTESRRFVSTMSNCHLHLAKRNDRFLVLAPLVGVCICFLLKVLYRRISVISKRQGPNSNHTFKPKGTRWRALLYDNAMSNDADGQLKDNFKDPSEEEESAASFEEMSHAYSELEPAYQKFLSDCGMSNWGYWRGGTAK